MVRGRGADRGTCAPWCGAAHEADGGGLWGDKSLTFGEVDAAANRIAHVLAGLGVARGGRVGLLIGNGIWSIPVDFGCVKAGAARVLAPMTRFS